MLYDIKLSKDEIEQIIYCLVEVSEEHKKIMLKYGLNDELYYTKIIKEYLENEMLVQDK